MKGYLLIRRDLQAINTYFWLLKVSSPLMQFVFFLPNATSFFHLEFQTFELISLYAQNFRSRRSTTRLGMFRNLELSSERGISSGRPRITSLFSPLPD